MAEKEEEKHGEGEAAEGGKSKKPLIIIIAVIVVLVIVGVAVAVMMMKSGGDEAAADGNGTHAEAGANGHGDKKAGASGKKDDKKKAAHGEEGKAGPMLMVDNVVVNLVSETGTRYTKISVAVELDDAHVMLEATAKKPMIQDIIISVISQKTADELVTYKGKEGCKTDILDKVNAILHDGTAKNVYFTSFIVQ